MIKEIRTLISSDYKFALYIYLLTIRFPTRFNAYINAIDYLEILSHLDGLIFMHLRDLGETRRKGVITQTTIELINIYTKLFILSLIGDSNQRLKLFEIFFINLNDIYKDREEKKLILFQDRVDIYKFILNLLLSDIKSDIKNFLLKLFIPTQSPDIDSSPLKILKKFLLDYITYLRECLLFDLQKPIKKNIELIINNIRIYLNKAKSLADREITTMKDIDTLNRQIPKNAATINYIHYFTIIMIKKYDLVYFSRPFENYFKALIKANFDKRIVLLNDTFPDALFKDGNSHIREPIRERESVSSMLLQTYLDTLVRIGIKEFIISFINELYESRGDSEIEFIDNYVFTYITLPVLNKEYNISKIQTYFE